MSRSFDAAVPSDGMTIDTPRGPVDLVALDRVQSWWPTRLTMAEKGQLDLLLTGCWEQAAQIAVGLGCTRESVLARVYRARGPRSARGLTE